MSKCNKRKDYDDNFDKCEQELKVSYSLIFHPDNLELTLSRHTGKKYVAVKLNRLGRLAIPELSMEVALHGEWVRFWHDGTLLPLPADLQRDLEETRRRADDLQHRADDLHHQLEQEQNARRLLEQELARLRTAAMPTKNPATSAQDRGR